MFPFSPLFGSVGFGNSVVIQALVQGGANVHDKDSDGITALSLAVLANHRHELKALVAAGTDVNAADVFGYSPLLYAATNDFRISMRPRPC